MIYVNKKSSSCRVIRLLTAGKLGHRDLYSAPFRLIIQIQYSTCPYRLAEYFAVAGFSSEINPLKVLSIEKD